MNTDNQTNDKAEEVIELNADSATSTPLPSPCEVDGIIRKRVYASLAVGLVPVPLVDIGALTAIQTEMIYRLSKAYGVPFNKEWGRKAVAFILGALAPVVFVPGVSSLLRYVPILGQGLAVTSGSLTFGAATYAVGQVFNRRLSRGTVISKEDLKEMGEEVKGEFVKAKDKVKSWVGKDKNKSSNSEGEGSPA